MLVITIIILLILAGITISSLTNSGLFNKVKEAKEKYKNAQEYEDGEIIKYGNEIDKYLSKNSRDTVTISSEDWADIQTKLNELDTLKANNNMKTYTSITQLGLTKYTTVAAIRDAMPDESMLNFMITTSQINESSIDIPEKGMVTMWRECPWEDDIPYVTCQLITNTGKFYIRYFNQGIEGTSVVWRDTGWVEK